MGHGPAGEAPCKAPCKTPCEAPSEPDRNGSKAGPSEGAHVQGKKAPGSPGQTMDHCGQRRPRAADHQARASYLA